MRITGGQLRGRGLFAPKGLRIRPTADPVREAVFSIIGQNLWGLNVLDLFAGTGSLGLEALSRGAQRALFIDNSPQAIDLIRKNLGACECSHQASVLRWDLRKGLPQGHPWLQETMDLVFLDPPYGSHAIPPLLEAISAADLLSVGSRAVAESARDETLPPGFGQLKMIDTRRYGDTRISLYAYEVTG
jgi:16S rRNA (guanine966-N2)-methyltransferase